MRAKRSSATSSKTCKEESHQVIQFPKPKRARHQCDLPHAEDYPTGTIIECTHCHKQYKCYFDYELLYAPPHTGTFLWAQCWFRRKAKHYTSQGICPSLVIARSPHPKEIA